MIPPIYDLSAMRHAQACVSLEAFSLASLNAATASLLERLPAIVRGFAQTPQMLALPELQVTRDQKKFLVTISRLPFSEAMPLTAYRPEGVRVSYLQYLAALAPVCTKLKDLQKNVVQPYLLFLAQVVSDRNASLSTRSQEAEYAKLDKERLAIGRTFSALYANDRFEGTCTVADVVDRNADWPEVFTQLNACLESLKSVRLDEMKAQLKQSGDYLDVLYDQLKGQRRSINTPEVAQRLASGAYCVAKELELFGSTYYRALALDGCVQNTVNHVRKAIG